jgi:hypothetical protein
MIDKFVKVLYTSEFRALNQNVSMETSLVMYTFLTPLLNPYSAMTIPHSEA